MTYTDVEQARQQQKSSMAQTIMTGSVSALSLAVAGMAMAGALPGESAGFDIGDPLIIQEASPARSSSTFTAKVFSADVIDEARLIEKLVQVHADLLENQSNLDAESQKILFDNLHNMYL